MHSRHTHARTPSLCVTGLRGGARGRDTRRGRTTDTAEPRAAVYTQINRPIPAPPAASQHQQRRTHAA
eukprot:6242138-Prymnesium_polylepis.1